MLNNKGKGSIAGQIIVAVVVALLVGGTAPWWWKVVFPDPSPPQPPTARPQPPTATLPPLGDNSVKPGEYPRLGYQVVEFAGIDQGWFQIEAEGRKGWIANDTWTISSKTNACQQAIRRVNKSSNTASESRAACKI